MPQTVAAPSSKSSFLRSLGPGIITACVVFGPGSLIVAANMGTSYGYDLLWLTIVTAILMGAYMTMAMRIGVIGGNTACTLIADRLGRTAAIVIAINLFLVCCAFQFANNLALAASVQALIPAVNAIWILLVANALIITFLFAAKGVYRILEFIMKIMVAVILVSFIANLIVAKPGILTLLKGFIPHLPANLSFAMPAKINGTIQDPLLLIASLFGTTFSVAAAIYQTNLVREKGWSVSQCRTGITDTISGVAVLGIFGFVITATTATVIPGQTASDVGALANSLKPLLGSAAHVLFCIGLLSVAMNPFTINAMIAGGILADGFGKPARLNDSWARCLTIFTLLIGMVIAGLILHSGRKPVPLIIFGQALTVVGNPLMAAAMLYLANSKKIMGDKTNGPILNIFGIIGLLIVIALAVRVLYRIILQLS